MSGHVRRVSLRPPRAGEERFVYEVFAAVRGARLATAGVPANALSALLEMQHRAQQMHYRAQYPDADVRLVLVDDEPIGYLYVHRGPQRVALVDVALLPAHSGQGVGSEVVGALLREATEAGKPVVAHVEKDNRASRLWRRMGFEVVADDGVHLAMERKPQREHP